MCCAYVSGPSCLSYSVATIFIAIYKNESRTNTWGMKGWWRRDRVRLWSISWLQQQTSIVTLPQRAFKLPRTRTSLWCMCVGCVWGVHMCIYVHEEVWGWQQVLPPMLPTFIIQAGSLTDLTVCQIWLMYLSNSCLGSLSLSPSGEIMWPSCLPGFYVVPEDLNSGHHAYWPSTLVPKPLLRPN